MAYQKIAEDDTDAAEEDEGPLADADERFVRVQQGAVGQGRQDIGQLAVATVHLRRP